MKTTSLQLIQKLALVLSAGVCLGPSRALAYSGGPDAGYTGAPGELNCVNCHTPPVARAGSVSLTGVPPVYKPGVTYGLTVTLNDTGNRRGFELTALNSSGAQAGNFASTSVNTQLPTFTTNAIANTRQYVSHTFASSTSNSWRFNWTAPNSAIGPVRFYLAGLRGDGLLTTTGDTTYTNLVTSLDNLRVAIARSGTNITLTWTGGTLQYVDRLVPNNTIWTNVPGNPTSPYTTNALQARRFYRTAFP
jgi:hypothetical protein